MKSESSVVLDKKKSAAELRKFGFMFAAFVCLLFGLLFPYLFNRSFSPIPWSIGGVVFLWALLAPGTMHVFYRYWIKFGNVLSFINTRLILGLVFYVMFMPFGLVMRGFGHDPMQRKIGQEVKTFRSIPAPRKPQHQNNPY